MSETRTDIAQTLTPTEAARFLGVRTERLLQLEARLLPERNERNHRVYRRDALERYQAERSPWNMAARLDELRRAAAVKGPAFEREFMAELEQKLATLSEGGQMGRIDAHLESSAPEWEREAMVEQMVAAGQRAERAERYNQTGRTDAAPGESDRFDGSDVVWPDGFDRNKAELVILQGGPQLIVRLHETYGKGLPAMSDYWVKGALDHVLNSQWNTERLEALMQASGYERAGHGWRKIAPFTVGTSPDRNDELVVVVITDEDRRGAAWQNISYEKHADYTAIVERAAYQIAHSRALQEEIAKRFGK